MAEFNFGSLATTQATSNVQQRLKPWDIYPVKFSGARIETIQGKKDPTQTYTKLTSVICAKQRNFLRLETYLDKITKVSYNTDRRNNFGYFFATWKYVMRNIVSTFIMLHKLTKVNYLIKGA